MRPQTIADRYELKEMVGSGGMSSVYRAFDTLLERHVALKILHEQFGGDDEHVERFRREARAVAQLSHPNIVTVIDRGEEDGRQFIVFELIDGENLKELVERGGPLPVRRVLELGLEIGRALAFAHAQGLVHRDVKPQNLMLCVRGGQYDVVKVLDFGLVKFSHRGTNLDTLATLDHTTTGTPAYMAPEIILGEADVDRRADVYALGCVAYYLLTGQLVFEAETPMKMLLQHLHAQPIPPSQRSELPIPRDLDELVLACLEKDPDKRPQDAEALFKLACDCRTCEGWNQELAADWWQVHLPELSGPLTVNAPHVRTGTASLVSA